MDLEFSYFYNKASLMCQSGGQGTRRTPSASKRRVPAGPGVKAAIQPLAQVMVPSHGGHPQGQQCSLGYCQREPGCSPSPLVCLPNLPPARLLLGLQVLRAAGSLPWCERAELAASPRLASRRPRRVRRGPWKETLPPGLTTTASASRHSTHTPFHLRTRLWEGTVIQPISS